MQTYQALRHHGDDFPDFETLTVPELQANELRVQVSYSDINYKDALAYRPDNKVVRSYPRTLGIDLAGVVLESTSETFNPGQRILATGFGLGVDHDGGYAQIATIPAGWAIKIPHGMTMSQAMAWGTAGLTAALCLDQLARSHALKPDAMILVGGATGGVGQAALRLLQAQGFQRRTAFIRQPDQADRVLAAGATDTLLAADLPEGQVLAKQRFDAVIDPLGGAFTTAVLPAIKYGGALTLCGNAAGTDLNTSVFPFILRGIKLLGVDSVNADSKTRDRLWTQLAATPTPKTATITFAELPHYLATHFDHSQDRHLVRISEETD